MTAPKVKVWDFPVRIFHWSLVTMFATAYFTSDDAEAPVEADGEPVSSSRIREAREGRRDRLDRVADDHGLGLGK